MRLPEGYVSIPFIAGQWSLRKALPAMDPERATRFNPLHCGAVVASQTMSPLGHQTEHTFQSPSLRGSGRFGSIFCRRGSNATCFNPLHCGAVVASRSRAARRGTAPTGFNPLHCGAVVASSNVSSLIVNWPRVSIPFIAGQWSLRGEVRGGRGRNDLGFNPLHCGAVVASFGGRRRRRRRRRVSIPFIAGQWSLHAGSARTPKVWCLFQSPSLRGSGRFGARAGRSRGTAASFNPLHCGAVVASR